MRLISNLLLAVVAAGPAAAPAPSPRPPEQAEKKTESSGERARNGQLANVRIDIKLMERRTATPVTKQISLTVADRNQGVLRSLAGPAPGPNPEGVRPASINVDAFPVIDGGKVRLRLSLDYNGVEPEGTKASSQLAMRHTLNVVVESGRALVVTDAADPVTDGRVAVEVTATILR